MTDRHLTGLFDGAEDIRAAIGQAVGLASMAWTPKPEGVFDTDLAANVVDELADWIERHTIGLTTVTDKRLRLALSDPGAYVPRELGLEDYEPVTAWQLRAVKAVLAGELSRGGT